MDRTLIRRREHSEHQEVSEVLQLCTLKRDIFLSVKLQYLAKNMEKSVFGYFKTKKRMKEQSSDGH